jgi:hypothetical protein
LRMNEEEWDKTAASNSGTVTGAQVLEAMKAANITHVDHHDCGGCGEMVFYSRFGDQLFFNPGCGCSYSPPEPRSWDEAADYINMQNDEWRAKLKALFGLPNAK